MLLFNSIFYHFKLVFKLVIKEMNFYDYFIHDFIAIIRVILSNYFMFTD